MDQPQSPHHAQLSLAYEAALHMLGKLHGMYGALVLHGNEEIARDLAASTASMARIALALAAQVGVEDPRRAVQRAMEEPGWPGA